MKLGLHMGIGNKPYLHLRPIAIACVGFALIADGARAAEKTVSMRDDFFSPRNITVQPGDSVKWTNNGNNQHTTTSGTAVWDSGLMQKNATFSFTFNTEGNFPYVCQVHGPSMAGSVTVGSAATGPTNDIFLINLTGKSITTNASGKITSAPERTADFIKDCADEHSRNAADLALVYDLQADAIEVVDRNDGSVVCTFATFTGGVALGTGDGNQRQRQAFVLWEDSTTANGSMTATETSVRNNSGDLVKFILRGAIQVGIPAYNDEPSTIFEGTFVTTRRFTVRAR